MASEVMDYEANRCTLWYANALAEITWYANALAETSILLRQEIKGNESIMVW